MQIELKEITVRELTKGYQDNEDAGVVGFDGKLDIRPPYQREFIYKDKQRDAVINTLTKSFPLNTMYWAVRDNGDYEVMDGQQRTVSICQYVTGEFSFLNRYFHNLQKEEQEQILDYKLMVYLCSGTSSEKLEWFKTINIASMKLTDQELRNAVYAGSWVSDAKRHFSKRDCAAYNLASKYLTGNCIRQDYLETAISWMTGGNIEEYMAKNQNEPNANELWLYFQSVINWVKATFPNYRKEMSGVNFGEIYNKFHTAKYDPKKLEEEISRLMQDEDVTKKSGIYTYVLTREEKYLNIREFTDSHKREAYERQKGRCIKCSKRFEFEEMEGDHIKPWHEGGKTIARNCQMLCKGCNRVKAGK